MKRIDSKIYAESCTTMQGIGELSVLHNVLCAFVLNSATLFCFTRLH